MEGKAALNGDLRVASESVSATSHVIPSLSFAPSLNHEVRYNTPQAVTVRQTSHSWPFLFNDRSNVL
jgi:hypothetical protein